jgi:acetyl-CoA synthetase
LGVTSVVIGGRFDADRWFHTIERYRVSMWYSAPTAYRMLMAAGDSVPKQYNLSSLRHICSVGEPLNPEALRWVKQVTGIAPHETWWMTETGMHIICNYRSHDFKIGCTGKPFPGTYATVVDDQGRELPPGELGHLVVRPGWPSMMHSIWNNPQKYAEYFSIPGWYVSGDTAYKDADGYLWYRGREDDVIKTAGERVGPFEVESALIEHPDVVEAGVIGKPDPVRGQIIKAYVALREGVPDTDEVKENIRNFVKLHLAAHAAPREIEIVKRIPKTRSGKIMRRVLRAWDAGEDVGDVSTMEA